MKVEFLPEAARETPKIYFGQRGYRIIYEIQRHRLVILIIGIGKRERAEIYREVARRLWRSD